MEKEIAQLTKTELLNPEFIPSIFEIYPDLPNNEIFREFKELPEKFFVDKK